MSSFFKGVLTVFNFRSNEIRLAHMIGEVMEAQIEGQGHNGGSNGNGATTGSNAAPSLKVLKSWALSTLVVSIVAINIF